MFSTCTNPHQLAIEIFNQSLRKSSLVNLLTNFTRKISRLKCFEEIKSDEDWDISRPTAAIKKRRPLKMPFRATLNLAARSRPYNFAL